MTDQENLFNALVENLTYDQYINIVIPMRYKLPYEKLLLKRDKVFFQRIRDTPDHEVIADKKLLSIDPYSLGELEYRGMLWFEQFSPEELQGYIDEGNISEFINLVLYVRSNESPLNEVLINPRLDIPGNIYRIRYPESDEKLNTYYHYVTGIMSYVEFDSLTYIENENPNDLPSLIVLLPKLINDGFSYNEILIDMFQKQDMKSVEYIIKNYSRFIDLEDLSDDEYRIVNLLLDKYL